METVFKHGKVIVMRQRGLIAAAGHNPDDHNGGSNAANAAAWKIVAARVRAREAHFSAEAWAALHESVRETFDGGCHNHAIQLAFKLF